MRFPLPVLVVTHFGLPDFMEEALAGTQVVTRPFYSTFTPDDRFSAALIVPPPSALNAWERLRCIEWVKQAIPPVIPSTRLPVFLS